ncbi:hypothetical protein TNCV_1517531 [Trichonephila clavipes]|nr:hypothetical protein TNCV_1517531 [Trichonephila clavipes]
MVGTLNYPLESFKALKRALQVSFGVNGMATRPRSGNVLFSDEFFSDGIVVLEGYDDFSAKITYQAVSSSIITVP